MLGALIPPIGIGLSAVIAKMTKKGKEEFDQQLLAGGFSTLILGLLGISEGVLPFIISDPMIIPISMIGAGIGGAIGFSLNVNVFPGSSYGFFMWPLVENFGGFVIALLAGIIAVICLMFIHEHRKFIKGKMVEVEK